MNATENPMPVTIKKLRKMLGLTQHEFGRLFAVSKYAVCLWERGKQQAAHGHRILIIAVTRTLNIMRLDRKLLKLALKSGNKISAMELLIGACQRKQKRKSF